MRSRGEEADVPLSPVGFVDVVTTIGESTGPVSGRGVNKANDGGCCDWRDCDLGGWCGIWSPCALDGRSPPVEGWAVRRASLAVPLRNPLTAVICPVGGVAAMYDRPE